MLHMTFPESSVGGGGAGPSLCITLHVHQLNVIHNQTTAPCLCGEISSLCLLTVVDRRGESEESGDDETRRRSINGDVDPNQPATTGK